MKNSNLRRTSEPDRKLHCAQSTINVEVLPSAQTLETDMKVLIGTDRPAKKSDLSTMSMTGKQQIVWQRTGLQEAYDTWRMSEQDHIFGGLPIPSA
jgi:phosphodiesterase/alkaline phosphatase D-like protein